MGTVSDAIESLMLANLISVFNERDEAARHAAVDRTYSEDVRWTDAEGVSVGRASLEAKCVQLQSTLGDLQFVAAGTVRELPGFGYLAWTLVEPGGGQQVMSGFDAARRDSRMVTSNLRTARVLDAQVDNVRTAQRSARDCTGSPQQSARHAARRSGRAERTYPGTRPVHLNALRDHSVARPLHPRNRR